MKKPANKLISLLKPTLLLLALFTQSLIAEGQLKVGSKAPEIVITNWLKNIPQSKELGGKFIVLDFWATWCAPCLESVPHMNFLVNKNKSKANLMFLAITNEKPNKVNNLLKRVQFSSVVVADTSQQTSEAFKANYIPFCVIIDDKNLIQWFGNPADLTDDIISSVMAKEVVALPKEKEPSLPKKIENIYKEQYTLYRNYMDDQDIKEYFCMGPILFKKDGFSFGRSGPKNQPYEEMVIGDSLIHRFSELLDLAEIQLVLANNLSGACISYCYKSRLKNKKAQVMDAILNQLDLKYTVADSLMDVIELEVIDRKKLERFFAKPSAHVGHSSASASYAGIEYEDFSKLANTIQNQFHKIVEIKQDSILKNKMSLTVKINSIRDLSASFKSYGIKTTIIKKSLPVYRFTKRK